MSLLGVPMAKAPGVSVSVTVLLPPGDPEAMGAIVTVALLWPARRVTLLAILE